MPFVIICPFCRSTLRAPDTTVGRKAKCPKCGRPVAVTAIATAPPQPAAPQPSVAPAFDNLGDQDDLTARRQRQRNASAGAGAAHSLGIGSMVLGVVALVFSFIPCVGVLSMPLSGLGLLLGIVGGIVALFRGGRGIGFPIAGGAINGMAIAVALVWLILARATSKAIDEVANQANATNERVEDGEKKVDPRSPGDGLAPPNPSSPVWVDATKRLRQGDVRVGITSVTVDQVQLEDLGQPSLSKDKLLIIRLQIENASETRKVEYESWGDTRQIINRHLPTLKDNFNNNYRRITFGFATRVQGQVSSESIHPGRSVQDVVLFEEPIERAMFLRLELPGSAFGGTGKLRFQIPRNMFFGQAAGERLDDEKAMQQAEEERKRRVAEEKQKAREEAKRKAEAKKAEERAAAQLRFAKKLADDNQEAKAKQRLQEIIKESPKTEAAKEARQLLEKLNQ